MNLNVNTALALSALIAMAASHLNAGWNPLPPLPRPNAGFACGAVAGKIVVLGGSNWEGGTKQWLDSICVLDPASLEWGTHGKLPHPLAYAVTAAWKHSLLIAGGSDGKHPRKEVWRVSPSLELEQVGELQNAAVLAVGGVLDGELLVFGGCADAAKLKGLRRGGDKLQLSDRTVAAFVSPGENALGLAAGVASGAELFIFGGVRYDPIKEYVNLADSWAYDPDRGSWRSRQPYPIAVHGSAAVSLDDHRILVAGGYGGTPSGFTAVAFIYDTRRNAYAKTMDLPVAGMVGLVRAEDFVYCLGGEDNSRGHRTAACARVRVPELLNAASSD